MLKSILSVFGKTLFAIAAPVLVVWMLVARQKEKTMQAQRPIYR